MGILNRTKLLIKLREVQNLPRNEITKYQHSELKKIVKYAIEHAHFYQELYKDIDLDDFTIQDLPPITKDNLMTDFNHAVTDPKVKIEDVRRFVTEKSKLGKKFLGRYIPMNTSGSTGRVGYFVYDPQAWDHIQVVNFLRIASILKKSLTYTSNKLFSLPSRKLRVAQIIAAHGHHASNAVLGIHTSRFYNLFVKQLNLSVMDPLEKNIEKLKTFQPDIIGSYPTYIEILAFEQRARRLKISPQVIISGGEHLSDRTRKIIEESFNGEIFNTYVTTEAMVLGAECEKHNGIHLFHENAIVEPVYRKNLSVPPDTKSERVLVTNLFNKILPIIRYEMNDVIRILKGKCLCGNQSPRIELEGRFVDMLWFLKKEGGYVGIAPPQLMLIFYHINGIKQYQLIQEDYNRLKVFYSCETGTNPEEIKKRIIKNILFYLEKQSINTNIQLEVEHLDEIRRDPKTKKIKQILNLVGTPQ